jgi:translation initiation factor 1
MEKLNHTSGVVYSTDPNFKQKVHPETPTAEQQNFRVHLDRRRGGKIVTIVRGFSGRPQYLSELGKSLKKQCGVGGTVKDNEILIQGNVRDKVIALLKQEGHIAKPSGG